MPSAYDPLLQPAGQPAGQPVAPPVRQPQPVPQVSPVVDTQGGVGAVAEQSSFMRVLSNQDIDAEEKRNKKEAEALQYRPEISSLASYVRTHWDAAKLAKFAIEERLLRCFRQRKGIYDPEDLAHIQKFGGSQIYMMLTNSKCRTIESWIRDVMIPAGDKPWSLDPTPNPDIPGNSMDKIRDQVASETVEIADYVGPEKLTPEMIDERIEQLRKAHEQEIKSVAVKESDRIEKRIDDHFSEGGFYDELSKFIKDFSTYPAAFMKGPIVRRKKMLVWEEGEGGSEGKRQPTLKWQYKRSWKRVSPFDIYLAPAAMSVQDGYLIERHRYRQSDIMKMKGVPGFNTASINEVLMEYNSGSLKDWLWTDQEMATLEGRPNEQEDPDALIEAIEFHGDIPGRLLIEWGVDEKKIDNPADPVPAVCILVGRWVIMARINEDPFGEKPYYSASFDSSNDSVWGEAPPEIMEDCQRACNAFARSTINNAAIASGPQVEVQRDRLDPGENPQRVYPWKLWFTKSDTLGHNREAIRFFQPNMMTDKLMKAYEYFFTQAGEQLGVPAYEQGLGGAASGAGKTAHGLSMLMNAASKIIKDAILDIDTKVIKKIVYNTWIHTVMYDEDVDYRGDINIIARASEYLIVQDMLQARRQEFLAITNNDSDMAIIGLEGRAKVLREIAKGLKMTDNIVPDDQDLQARLEMSMMQAANAAAMGQPAAGPQPGGGARPGVSSPKPGMDDMGGKLPPMKAPPLEIAAKK